MLLGDSTWDAVAGQRADVPVIALRTGGFSEEELRAAGAVGVYESLPDLRADLDNTPLSRTR